MHKNLQLTLAWFILAFLVTGTAVWQAQVTVSRDISAKNAAPPPPPKTRHAVRNSGHEVAAVSGGDPIEKYTARLRRGLSDREIGWIIDDFQFAGLDLGIRAANKEDYLAQRQTQDRWYHDTLVEAWSLTPTQSAEVTGQLAKLFDQSKADFIEALASGPRPFQHKGKWYNVTSAAPIHLLIDANRRLQDPSGAYLPWNLCEMPPEYHPSLAEDIPTPDQNAYQSTPIIDPVLLPPADPSLFTVDPVLPRPDRSPEDSGVQVIPPAGDILAPLRKLHPSQLKLLLLIDPDRARKIKTALDTAK